MSQAGHIILPGPHQYPVAHPGPVTAPDQLDVQMILGAVAVAMMLLCRWQQDRSRLLVAGTIFFGFMAGVYGIRAGAWPLGVAVIVYAIMTYQRWLKAHLDGQKRRTQPPRSHRVIREVHEARLGRLFGLN